MIQVTHLTPTTHIQAKNYMLRKTIYAHDRHKRVYSVLCRWHKSVVSIIYMNGVYVQKEGRFDPATNTKEVFNYLNLVCNEIRTHTITTYTLKTWRVYKWSTSSALRQFIPIRAHLSVYAKTQVRCTCIRFPIKNNVVNRVLLSKS